MVDNDFYRGQRPFLPQFPLPDMIVLTHQSVPHPILQAPQILDCLQNFPSEKLEDGDREGGCAARPVGSGVIGSLSKNRSWVPLGQVLGAPNFLPGPCCLVSHQDAHFSSD